MSRPVFILLVLAVMVFLVSDCTPKTETTKAALGQNVSLTDGQTVEISGEDLKIKFVEITEDSRCPTGATCIWAGQASASVELTKENITTTILLTEPGESSDQSRSVFQDYFFRFHIEPYPNVDKPIDDADYRLLLTVIKNGTQNK